MGFFHFFLGILPYLIYNSMRRTARQEGMGKRCDSDLGKSRS